MLPAALIRIGLHSLATRLSTLAHEAGHQGGVDLGLLTEAARVIGRAAGRVLGSASLVDLWMSWSGELLADAWAASVGGAPLAVDGLQRLLAIAPGPVQYLFHPGAPHPPGMLRVRFLIEFGRRLDADPILDHLERRWNQVYGTTFVLPDTRGMIKHLSAAVPAIAAAVSSHRFVGLGGVTLAEAAGAKDVRQTCVERVVAAPSFPSPAYLAGLSPLLAVAALGRARLVGALTPGAAEQASRRLLESLAMRRSRARHQSIDGVRQQAA